MPRLRRRHRLPAQPPGQGGPQRRHRVPRHQPEPDALSRFGAGIEAIRRSLHGVDQAGTLHVGADCAIEIWRRTPGDTWLAATFGARPIRPLTRLGYDGFASILYAWNRRKGHW